MPANDDRQSAASDAFISIALFLACKSDPPQPQIVQQLAWRIQRHTVALPSLQFLVQCATVDHLLSAGPAAMHAVSSPAPVPASTSSPESAGLVALVSRLCGYLDAMSAAHPSHAELSAVNARLRVLLRLHVVLYWARGEANEAASHTSVLALLHALFPAVDSVADDDDEEEVCRLLRDVLIRRSATLQSALELFPYTPFLEHWQRYYRLCQCTPTFSDVDLDLLHHVRGLIAPAVAAPPSSPPTPPHPPSPVPRRLREGPVVLDKPQLSVAELFAMLKQARVGVPEATVRREWQQIMDGTHDEVLRWKANQRSAAQPQLEQMTPRVRRTNSRQATV